MDLKRRDFNQDISFKILSQNGKCKMLKHFCPILRLNFLISVLIIQQEVALCLDASEYVEFSPKNLDFLPPSSVQISFAEVVLIFNYSLN